MTVKEASEKYHISADSLRYVERKKKYDEALQRLEDRIERYEEALKTGELLWNQENFG